MEEEDVSNEQENSINNEVLNQKFLLKVLSRESRVDACHYQAQIPHCEQQNLHLYKQQLYNHRVQNSITNKLYQSNKVPQDILEEYLNFSKQLATSKNEGLLIGTGSLLQIEERALNFLGQMDYSVIKAKFYLLFPTLLYFNTFKKNIDITEKEMDNKINEYIKQLQETKISQNEKWQQDLKGLLNGRVEIGKIQHYIEQGKQLKYEIPEQNREILDKAHKTSKELRKLMTEKTDIENLQKVLEITEIENKIITNEENLLRKMIERSNQWLEKIDALNQVSQNQDKVQFRQLQQVVLEYKNLSIAHINYEQIYKPMYDQAAKLLEEIPNFTRTSKTRGTVTERISFGIGRVLCKKINMLNVTCEEFELFKEIFEKSQTEIENVQMFLNDDRQEKNYKIFLNLQNSLNEIPFHSSTQECIKNKCEYFSLMDKIRKASQNHSKLEDIAHYVEEAKKKDLYSKEMQEEEIKAKQAISWYDDLSSLIVERPDYQFIDAYAGINVKPPLILEQKLLEMESTADMYNIEESSLDELKEKMSELNTWKNQLKQTLKVSFEDIHQSVNQVIKLNVDFNELRQTVIALRKGVDWVLESCWCIKQNDKTWKCSFFNDSILQQLINKYLEKHKSSVPIINIQDLISAVSMDSIPKFCINSPEHQRLEQLYQQANDWNLRVQHILEQSQLDFQNISDQIPQLLKESESLPINKQYKESIQNLSKNYQWAQKVQDTISELEKENELVLQIKSLGIEDLVSKISEFENNFVQNNQDQQDHIKLQCFKFWQNNYEIIISLLQNIQCMQSKQQVKIKLTQLQKLLNDFQNSKGFFENYQQKLSKIIEKVDEWVYKSEELREFDKKKRRIMKKPRKHHKESNDMSQLDSKENQVKIADSYIIGQEDLGFAAQIEQEEVDNSQKEPKDEQEEDKGAKVQNDVVSQVKYHKKAHLFYLKLPYLLIHYYEGLKQGIQVDELNLLNEIIQEIYKCHISAEEFISVKPKYQDVKAFIQKAVKNNFYLISVNILKKLVKWATSWTDIAQVITNTQPKLKSSRQQIISSLPANFGQDIISIKFDTESLIVEVEYNKVDQIDDESNNFAIPNKKKLQLFSTIPEDDSQKHDSIKCDNSSKSSKENEDSNDNKMVDENDGEESDKDDDSKEQKKEKHTRKSHQTIQEELIINKKRKRKRNTFYQDDIINMYNSKTNNDDDQQYQTKNPKFNKKGNPKFNQEPKELSDQKKRKFKNFKKESVLKLSKNNSSSKKQLKERVRTELLSTAFENPDEKFCICRDYQNSTNMVQCDSCEEWFHCECIGIKSTQAKNLDEYICLGCCSRYNLPYLKDSHNSFVWNFLEKITLSEFQKVLQEGRQIPLKLDELDELEELYKIIQQWMTEANILLEKGNLLDVMEQTIQNDIQDDKFMDKINDQYDLDIFKLYLHQFRLPIAFKEAELILQLLHQRDLGRIFLKQLYLPSQQKYDILEKTLTTELQNLNTNVIQSDNFLSSIYERLQEIYIKSQKSNETAEIMMKEMTDSKNFQSFLEQVEKENLLIENFKEYRQELSDLKKWEARASGILMNEIKISLIDLQKMINDFTRNFRFTSQYKEKLEALLQSGNKWYENTQKYLQDPNSQDDEKLINLYIEGQNLAKNLEIKNKQKIDQNFTQQLSQSDNQSIVNILSQYQQNLPKSENNQEQVKSEENDSAKKEEEKSQKQVQNKLQTPFKINKNQQSNKQLDNIQDGRDKGLNYRDIEKRSPFFNQSKQKDRDRASSQTNYAIIKKFQKK